MDTRTGKEIRAEQTINKIFKLYKNEKKEKGLEKFTRLFNEYYNNNDLDFVQKYFKEHEAYEKNICDEIFNDWKKRELGQNHILAWQMQDSINVDENSPETIKSLALREYYIKEYKMEEPMNKKFYKKLGFEKLRRTNLPLDEALRIGKEYHDEIIAEENN